MTEILIFTEIKNGNIFEPEFQDLLSTDNANIEFKMQSQARGGIAVIYAPNGTGKTSLCRTLSTEEETGEIYFQCNYNESIIRGADKQFHVINDHVSRNIIPGDTADYLIGADIRREYELKKRIAQGFPLAFNNLAKVFKEQYKVSKVGDFLLNKMTNVSAVDYLKNILPNRTRGRNIDKAEFAEFIRNTARIDLVEMPEEKIRFVIDDSVGSKLVEKILDTHFEEIIPNAEIHTIEQNDDAIVLINKYKTVDTCIVCDSTEFYPETQLQRKEDNRRRIYESLDIRTRAILDEVVNDQSLKISDPFHMKDTFNTFLCSGQLSVIQEMIDEISLCISYITSAMHNSLLCCFDNTSMLNDYADYLELLDRQPQIDSEELLYIQEIIGENIGPEITIIRDDANDKNFKLMLGGQDFLGKDRDALHLSTGEQNFISLSFELLLARKSEKEFIVMDDPISSFDSVYKNRIAFCIVKFLEDKKQIILTHNTDLIRLLEVQQNGCFNLYLFGNSEGGNNGFIQINAEEREILINLYKLIKLFQNHNGVLVNNVRDEKQFLMAMIPFMRGYAHISKGGDGIYSSLSGVMHGYSNSSVNVTEIYKQLFDYQFAAEYEISVDDVLNLDLATINIMCDEQYPLLSETLKQTLIYYYLRMKVEKELVDIFNLSLNPDRPLMLNQIIRRAFNYSPADADAEVKRNYKVFFTSRKTLLNEFNHFEGNMNIFQPAIDIERSALQKEIDLIENKLVQLRDEYYYQE